MADVGRPTIMTDDVVNKLEEAFSNGATDLEACFLANISKQTLYNYQENHPEFVDRKEALKEMIKYQAKKNIKDKILEGDIQQSNWWLERKGKDEGFNQRQELTGKDGDNLIPQPLLVKFIDCEQPKEQPNSDGDTSGIQEAI